VTPDRDLDQRVAEKVMGLKQPGDFGTVERHDWVESEYSEYNQFICRRCHDLSKDWADRADLEPGPCEVGPDLYSSNVAAAWTVVEHMRAEGWSISLSLDRDGTTIDDKLAWTVVLSRNSVRHGDPAGLAGAADLEAPRAICRAALRAVGVAVPSS
jgi:hypothetical protein